MRCVVTGAAGFIGSTICDRLLERGDEVVAIDSFSEYYPRRNKEKNLEGARTQSRFTFVEGSLLNIDLLPLLSNVDLVFHQAAQAGVRKSWGAYFESYVDNNVLGTQRLLEACRAQRSIKKVIYASSSSIYGNAESYPTREDTIPRPVSPYGVTKLAAEHLAGVYAKEFEVPAVSLRYFTVFGPRQRPDMAFYRFIAAALRGREITVYDDGEQTRDFTFVDDIVSANLLAAEKGEQGAVYNLGGGTQATVNNVIDILRAEIGTVKAKYLERQLGDARRTSADTTRARSKIGFAPQIDLREGIRREIEWLRGCLSAGLVVDWN